MASHKLSCIKRNISLTVSAGIAVAHEHNFNEREILRAADEVSYAAKQAGCEHVVINLGEN